MKRWIGGFTLLAGIVAGAAALWLDRDRAAGPPTGPVWFADMTDESGIDFVHEAGDLSKFWQPQIHGSGVAIFDFDGDQLLDVYLLTYGGPDSKSINRLYKNLGNGKFKDVTAGSGLGIAGHNTGVIAGDVNNDGRPDVVVSQFGGVKLFLNNGNGSFSDVSANSGLQNPLWGNSMNLVDYDRDGWLDLVIVNFLEFDPFLECHHPTGRRDYCGPTSFPGTVSKLFRNRGGQGKPGVFEDVTVKAGLAKHPGPGLGVYCADFDGDGWPDIFIANDGKPNHLFVNQKDGTFREEGFTRGLAVDALGQAQAGMGIAAGDVSGSGLFDIYITHLNTEHNTLWQQGPRGQFRDRTAKSGLLGSDWRGTGFGTLMADFDHDGWLDIAVANGRIAWGSPTPNPKLGDHLKDYAERNQLFRNEGAGNFRDISGANTALCGMPNVARGLAAGDLDGDGGIDLIVTTVAGKAQVLRNVAKERGHWLSVRALDPRWQRDAFGAELRLHVGDRKLLRIINPGDSFQSSSDPRAHFGLGKANHFEAIEVLWPDGRAELFPGGPADRVIEVVRGQGKELTAAARNP